MDAHRVLVGRLHPLDLLERERLHAFLGVLLEAVLDVRGDELAAVERRHVVPLDALAQLEGPHALVGAARPGFREVALEREVGGIRRLVGEREADEAAADEGRDLEEADGIRQPRIEDGRVPGGGPGEGAAALRRLGARRDPVGIGRRGLSRCPPRPGALADRGRRGGSQSHALQEVAAIALGGGGAAAGVVGEHPRSPFLVHVIGDGILTKETSDRDGFSGPALPALGRVLARLPYRPRPCQAEAPEPDMA